MEQKFKVIYTGHLQGDAEIQIVTSEFAKKFKMSETKARKILQAGRDVALHSGAEHVKAYQLKSALEELGLQVRLERVQIVHAKSSAENPLAKGPAQQATLQDQKTSTSSINSNQQAPPETKPSLTPSPTPKSSGLNSNQWALEPMEEEAETSEATTHEDDRDSNHAVSTAKNNNSEPKKSAPAQPEFVDMRVPTSVLANKPVETDVNTQNSSLETDTDDSEAKEEKKLPLVIEIIVDVVKQFGAIIAAIVVFILFVMKNFGLFKFLKISGLMAATAYAGYNPEEACMGNGECEDAISDQIDDCWTYSDLDQFDWEEMPEEQYFALKPKVEKEFISCFQYEDSGERVLESPIELRFDLIDMCDMLSVPVSDCKSKAEKQVKACYVESNIIKPIEAAGYDYYTTMLTDMEYFEEFYGCFKDDNGGKLFGEFVDELDSEAMNEALLLIQEELES